MSDFDQLLDTVPKDMMDHSDPYAVVQSMHANGKSITWHLRVETQIWCTYPDNYMTRSHAEDYNK